MKNSNFIWCGSQVDLRYCLNRSLGPHSTCYSLNMKLTASVELLILRQHPISSPFSNQTSVPMLAMPLPRFIHPLNEPQPNNQETTSIKDNMCLKASKLHCNFCSASARCLSRLSLTRDFLTTMHGQALFRKRKRYQAPLEPS